MAAARRNRCKGELLSRAIPLLQTNAVSTVPAGNPPRPGYQIGSDAML
jgi:hypothetical protein